MTSSVSNFSPTSLHRKPGLLRNQANGFMTGLASVFATIAVLPLIFVIAYVLYKGFSVISPLMFVQLPPPPGLEGGGIGNALLGTLLVT